MLTGHARALLQFSGGKDSTALLHMARPWLDRIEVVTVNAGANFPHVQAHIDATLAALGVTATVLWSDSATWVQSNGLPADLVPVESAEAAPFMDNEGPRLVNYLSCCFANIMRPMHDYVRASGHTLVLRGSKRDDSRVGVPSGFVEEGVEYRSPLWEWSDAEVFSYLDGAGVALPSQYAAGVNDGLDCWFCPAHLKHHGAEKLRYLKANYPDLWPVISHNVRTVADAARHEMSRLVPAWDLANLEDGE